MTQPPPVLAGALHDDEPARWAGTVETERDVRRAVTVTDRRIVLEEPGRPEGWVSFDIADVAARGTLLPYSTVLAIADQSAAGPVRYSMRAVDPPTFDGIEWPPGARPAIDRQLVEAAASRERVRASLGRIVAAMVAGLGLLLVVLVVVLLVA